jgi:hypothetical protein
MQDKFDREGLEVAKRYIDNVINRNFHRLEPLEVCSVLELLAITGYEDIFRIVVDAYLQQIKCNGRIDNPYGYVEWLCRVGDHDNDFVVVGSYDTKKRSGLRIVGPPAGKAQELFQKLYGEHFF